jgi:histone H3/H4
MPKVATKKSPSSHIKNEKKVVDGAGIIKSTEGGKTTAAIRDIKKIKKTPKTEVKSDKTPSTSTSSDIKKDKVKKNEENIDENNKEKKERKKRRFRPGTRALLEIKKFQSGEFKDKKCISRTGITRLIREILSEHGDYRVSKKTIDAFHEISEDVMVKLMQDAQKAAIHSNRIEVQKKDIKFANLMRNDQNPRASTLPNSLTNNHHKDDGYSYNNKRTDSDATDSASTNGTQQIKLNVATDQLKPSTAI